MRTPQVCGPLYSRSWSKVTYPCHRLKTAIGPIAVSLLLVNEVRESDAFMSRHAPMLDVGLLPDKRDDARINDGPHERLVCIVVFELAQGVAVGNS